MYLKALLILTVLVTGTISSSSSSNDESVCPKVTVMPTLDMEKFVGKWYQHASYGNMFIHGLDKCVFTDYSLSEDKITISMNNKRQVIKSNTLLESTWKAVLKNEKTPDGNFTLTLRFPFFGSKQVSLLVLGSDYENFAVMVACGKVGFLKFVAGYIFTRKALYSTDGFGKIKKDVEDVLKDNNLQYEDFSETDQSDCDAPVTVQQTVSGILKKGLKLALSGGSLALILG